MWCSDAFTTGENWQFLRLDGQAILIDTTRHYINDVASILAAFLSMTRQPGLMNRSIHLSRHANDACSRSSTLTVSDVSAEIAYYLRHRSEIAHKQS